MRASRVLGSICAAVLALASARAEELPKFMGPGFITSEPSLDGLIRLRFVTTLDFPPFNFADENKKPTGFNVDLARAICQTLSIQARCEIQAVPWEELAAALQGRRAEAIIAGYDAASDFRSTYRLSAPYFRFPARFVRRLSATSASNGDSRLADLPLQTSRVGVLANSAHAAYMAEFFPDTNTIAFPDTIPLYGALQNGEVDYVFGDGVSLSFWITAETSQECCAFAGPPVFHADYFGSGMVVAVRESDEALQDAINAALRDIEENGIMQELFVRYFPASPFAMPE